MSDILEAVILGVVQGLTEFLPVSSSGHLEIFKYLFGYEGTGEQSLMLTVTLHGATALSTLVVFWKDIVQIFKDLFKFEWNEGTQLSAWIVLSMIPAAVVGVFFEDQLEILFEGQILLVAFMLLITAGLLWFADRVEHGHLPVDAGKGVVIGLAQAVAILPGISRSGATIATSILLKVDREKAARFSFLMVLPLIAGKIAKDLLGGEYTDGDLQVIPIVAGSIAAFVVGVMACKWMIAIVKRSQLKYFALYCVIVAAIVIVSVLI